MSTEETVFIETEETVVEAPAKRGVSPWLLLGGLLVVVAFVLGWRNYDAKKKRERPAEPTEPLP
jgi:hypothetical protein